QALRSFAARKTPWRLRGILLTVQIGFALVLLIGSALLVKSALRMTAAERNFDPHGILSFQFQIPLAEYLKALGRYHGVGVMEVVPPAGVMQQIREKLRTIPGAESVAGISFAAVNSLVVPSMNFTDDGGAAANAAYFIITPGFFATLRTPFV